MILRTSFKYLIVITTALVAACSGDGGPDRIIVDLAQKGADIPKSMYGIFFEEITHSGDGGIYAEMVRNRGFENANLPSGTYWYDDYACCPESPCYSNDSINDFRIKWDFNAMDGWHVESEKGAFGYELSVSQPLNPATPHHINIFADKSEGRVRLVNSGYWGMAIKEGQLYDAVFHLRTADGGDRVSVGMLDNEGNIVVEKEVKVTTDGQWRKYETSFTAPLTSADMKLAIIFEPKGTVSADFISLFPRETFMGRKNGLRNDVARMLADMKPGFVRWPGGCIVEGLTMENRVKWKETIGDPASRPGEYNLWGYRSTYGFGYHEFLQFCEDIDSKAMFVCNAGMSCLFRNGDMADADGVDELIDEALDAIEYAIGGTDTRWGSERAANGHPDPFPLKYIEVGNENIGPRYAVNYNRFHKAIKERYPQITVISALMFSKHIDKLDEVEFIDPHYYETADWFYNNADVYDKLPDDLPYKVYVGEYAAIGRSSLYSSLAEAAFLTGAERNSDKVQMVSYAPLIENAAYGRDHLLVLNSAAVYGRTNYWVVRMYAENMPDHNLGIKMDNDNRKMPVCPSGFVGLGTGGTSAEFKDFRVEKGGKVVYSGDWSDFGEAWHVERGGWKAENGVLVQPETHGDPMIWLKGHDFGDCTIRVKARKTGGVQGFRVIFGGRDEGHYFMADIGTHTNESVIFREIGDKGSVSLFDYRNEEPVSMGHWYDVRIEIGGNNWKCYLDDELKYEYNHFDVTKHYAVAGYDRTAKEIVVKLVNGCSHPWKSVLSFRNAGTLGKEGRVIELSSPDIDMENSFEEPEKIVPVERVLTGVRPEMKFSCPPNSFTILRIPVTSQ